MKKVIRFASQLEPAADSLRVWWHKNNGAPLMFSVELFKPPRNVDQNAKLWCLLTDISTQVDWYGQKYSKEDWKDILSASWKRQNLAPGIDGGMVALGVRTSQMSRQEFSELIELAYAFGAEHGVVWSGEAAA